MVVISIASLIYKSPTYADWIYDSIHEFTPKIKNNYAEFFFVANDPTDELLEHLKTKGYPYYVNYNPKRTEEELFKMGYGEPEYIHRVYRGWNKAIINAKGEIVILVNSDNFFSPDWLENLLKYLSPTTIVCSKLVERKHPKYGIFPGAYHCEFGTHPNNFDKKAFLNFCEKNKTTGIEEGGAYMPCMFYKDLAIKIGLYPEGNIAGSSFKDVIGYGDQVFFNRLSKIGVKHVTALDSIVYHLKEGEMDETSYDKTIYNNTDQNKRIMTPENQLNKGLLPIIINENNQVQYLSIRKTGIWQFRNLKNRVKSFAAQNIKI